MDSHTVPSALRDEEINRAHETVAQLHKELAARKADFDQLQQVLNMYQQSGGAPAVDTQIKTLESALSEANQRYAEAISEVSRLSQHVGWLETQGVGGGESPPSDAGGAEVASGRLKELELQLKSAQAEVKSLKDSAGKDKGRTGAAASAEGGSAVLKARVVELEQSLKEKELQHQQFIDAIQETENDSNARLAELQEQLASATRDGEAASEKVARERTDLLSSQAQLTEKIKELEGALTEAQASGSAGLSEAQQKIADLEHTMSARETMHTQFVQAVQETQDEATARVAELEAASEKAAARVAELEAAVEESAARVADLERKGGQAADYKGQLDLKEDEFQTLLAQLADADARVTAQKTEYESRLNEAQARVQEMEGQFASAQVLLQDSQQEKQGHEQGIQEIERVWSEKLQAAEARIQELEKSWSEKLEALELTHAEKIKAAGSQTEEAAAASRGEMDTLRAELEESDRVKAEALDRIKELEEQVSSRQEEFTAMETQLSVVNELLSSTGGDVHEKNERIEQLESAVTAGQAALAAFRQGVEALLNQVDQATSDVGQAIEVTGDAPASLEETPVEAAAG